MERRRRGIAKVAMSMERVKGISDGRPTSSGMENRNRTSTYPNVCVCETCLSQRLGQTEIAKLDVVVLVEED